MARLREAVDQAKCAFEEDVQKQNMEIANLKDTLLEARRASKGKKFIHKLKFDFVLSCILYYIQVKKDILKLLKLFAKKRTPGQ